MTGTGRTALVTGAGGGIGQAVCRELHRRGHHVLVSARDGEQARSLARALGCRAGALQLDVTAELSGGDLRAQLDEVDILVSNAGVLLDDGRGAGQADLGAAARTWQVNVLGGWRVAQAALPGMRRRGWGRVVFVSSGTGSFANGLAPRLPTYSLSKAGLNALTVLLAGDTRGSGILVNAVNPGPVRTRLLPAGLPGAREPDAAAVDVADAAELPDGGPTGCLLRGERVLPW